MVLNTFATITTTPDHLFWNHTDQQWQAASTLNAGDYLLAPNADKVVATGLIAGSKEGYAYNLTVSSVHTYNVLAGEVPVLVRNCGGEVAGWISKADFSDVKVLSKKYDSHAADFGITGNRNKANLAAFENAMLDHMAAPGAKIYRFNYRGQGQAVGFIDPSTNQMVMLHADSGKFWTAYRLDDNQFSSIIDRGFLW